MIDFILNFFIFVLLVISLLGVLVVLMQKTSAQAGMGAALSGGGAADQAFGAESATVLTKATQTLTIIFFVLAFLLYLGFQARHQAELQVENGEGLLPAAVPEETPVLEPENNLEDGATTEVTVEPKTENNPETEPQP